jgi:murein DD-endopeptidase MepM/ murein hydrolase activator NlpD
LLHASVGFDRVLGHLRRPRDPRSSSATALQVRSLAVANAVRQGLQSAVDATHLVPVGERRAARSSVGWTSRRSLVGRLGPDRAVALAVAGVLLGASVVSVSAGAGGPRPATGGTIGDGPAPRVAVGGGAYLDRTGDVEYGQAANDIESDFTGVPVDVDLADVEASAGETGVTGPFLDDGTLLKPVAVDTTVEDGRDLVRTYTVKAGDSLSGIAKKFRVSTMTVWWANNLKSKDDLHKGEVLRIPPVNGLIVTVAATDTLDSIAARYDVRSTDILATNGLDDANLVVGQVLILPGAAGKPIPTPKPPAKPSTSGGGGGSVRPPTTYSGGSMLWPVVGGGNYISQYFHYGHYAIDIAADYGSRVRAAASGTVIFAGWKNNGGGYQVWIAHGSNLYTTYNHMSAITVGRGQYVGRGQQVGRVGQSGNATGPHLHFEVWRGMVWDGGTRLNPLAFL